MKLIALLFLKIYNKIVRTNKTVLTAILLFLNPYFSSGQNKTESAHKLLESLIKTKSVVGVSGGYVVNGSMVWQSAAGFSDNSIGKAFTTDTQVRTASIAKPMTAIAVMQLVEQGLIDINLPVDVYIPEFIQKNATKITTKQLLSHTSGIAAYKTNAERQNQINYNTLLEAYDVFKNRELSFKPGTDYLYTSYGYVILGILIEKVSCLSYEAYMQKHIWDKANMTHTGIEKPKLNCDYTSKLYLKDNRGKLKAAQTNNLSNRIPGGGFYSTTNDILNFGNAILNNTLISEKTLGLMMENCRLDDSKTGYGLGFTLYGKQKTKGLLIGHSGSQIGASTQLFILPKTKTVVAILANTSGAINELITVAKQLLALSSKKD